MLLVTHTESTITLVSTRRLTDVSVTAIMIYSDYLLTRNKSRLLFLSAEMFKKPLLQLVWTQIRLLL